MNRRIVGSLVTIAAVTAVACVDMSAPKGAASISQLILPSPSVVVGDTMRDSLGAVAPLNVIAYDADNAPISGLATVFFIPDTGAVAHLAKSNFLVGDKQGTVHIIGQVSGIQTLIATIPVTVAPTTFALAATTPFDTLRVPLTKAGDTTSASTGTQAIGVTLKGIGDTASLGFVVTYQLVSAPATAPSSPTPAVFIANEAGKPSLVDTTDASGASRTVVVKTGLLLDATKPDSVVVLVSTSYKGKQVPGSPIHVKLPIKLKF